MPACLPRRRRWTPWSTAPANAQLPHAPAGPWPTRKTCSCAARLPAASDHQVQLCSELAACLGGTDLHLQAELCHGFHVDALAFSPNGRWLALGGTTGNEASPCVRLVEIPDGRVLRELAVPPTADARAGATRLDGIRSLAVSPDDRWLLAGTISGRLHRWDSDPPFFATRVLARTLGHGDRPGFPTRWQRPADTGQRSQGPAVERERRLEAGR